MSDFVYSHHRGPIAIQLSHPIDNSAVFDDSGRSACFPTMFYNHSPLRVSASFFSISFDPIFSVEGCRIVLPRTEGGTSLYGMTPLKLRGDDLRSKLLNKLKVRHSQLWKSTRDLSEIPELHTDSDWTFTTTYWGGITTNSVCKASEKCGQDCVSDFFPMNKLCDTSRPIKLFKEFLFWEDELDDNGHAQYRVRFRLMEDFLFILATYELRVDGVLDSRSIETRVYVDLSPPIQDSKPFTILREFKWIESGVSITDLWHQETIRIA